MALRGFRVLPSRPAPTPPSSRAAAGPTAGSQASGDWDRGMVGHHVSGEADGTGEESGAGQLEMSGGGGAGQLDETAAGELDDESFRFGRGESGEDSGIGRLYIEELLITEKVYVGRLRRLSSRVLIPLHRALGEGQAILTHDQIKSVFSNVELILQTNDSFVKKLAVRLANWTQCPTIVDIFAELAPFLGRYLTYTESLAASLANLDRELADNQRFRQLIADFDAELAAESVAPTPPTATTASGSEPGAKCARDYLQLPFQRVQQYARLLGALLDSTDSSDADFVRLQSLAEEFEGAVSSINNSLGGQLITTEDEVSRVQKELGLSDLVAANRILIRYDQFLDAHSATVHSYLFSDLLLCAVHATTAGDLPRVVFREPIWSLVLLCDANATTASATATADERVCLRSLSTADGQELWLGELGSGMASWITELLSVQEAYLLHHPIQSAKRRSCNLTNVVEQRKLVTNREQRSSTRGRLGLGVLSPFWKDVNRGIFGGKVAQGRTLLERTLHVPSPTRPAPLPPPTAALHSSQPVDEQQQQQQQQQQVKRSEQPSEFDTEGQRQSVLETLSPIFRCFMASDPASPGVFADFWQQTGQLLTDNDSEASKNTDGGEETADGDSDDEEFFSLYNALTRPETQQRAQEQLLAEAQRQRTNSLSASPSSPSPAMSQGRFRPGSILMAQKKNLPRKVELNDVTVKQGPLTKLGKINKNWQRRHFVLTPTNLYYFRNQSDVRPVGDIPLDEHTTVRIDEEMLSKNFCFQISTPGRTFFVYADNKRDMDSWLDTLTAVVAAIRSGQAPPSAAAAAAAAAPTTKSGYLTKQGGVVKNWKRRWFFLQNHVLYYFKTPVLDAAGAVKSTAKASGAIPLEADCSVRQAPDAGKPHCLQLNTRDRTYLAYADDADQLDEWITAIRESIVTSSAAQST